MADTTFDPANVNLTDASDDLITQITCYLQTGQNEYNGSLGMSSYPSHPNALCGANKESAIHSHGCISGALCRLVSGKYCANISSHRRKDFGFVRNPHCLVCRDVLSSLSGKSKVVSSPTLCIPLREIFWCWSNCSDSFYTVSNKPHPLRIIVRAASMTGKVTTQMQFGSV